VTGVHQFVRIGDYAFIGACSKATQDVPPYFLVDGHPCVAHGINLVGLRGAASAPEALRDLRRAYRTLYKSSRNLGDALDEIEGWTGCGIGGRQLVEFVRTSERGIVS
jgi:UDP-N-acetylglucosamine acyltransferase